jgi:hypothetical protein
MKRVDERAQSPRLRLPADLYQRIRAVAHGNGYGAISEFVRDACEEKLARMNASKRKGATMTDEERQLLMGLRDRVREYRASVSLSQSSNPELLVPLWTIWQTLELITSILLRAEDENAVDSTGGAGMGADPGRAADAAGADAGAAREDPGLPVAGGDDAITEVVWRATTWTAGYPRTLHFSCRDDEDLARAVAVEAFHDHGVILAAGAVALNRVGTTMLGFYGELRRTQEL